MDAYGTSEGLVLGSPVLGWVRSVNDSVLSSLDGRRSRRGHLSARKYQSCVPGVQTSQGYGDPGDFQRSFLSVCVVVRSSDPRVYLFPCASGHRRTQRPVVRRRSDTRRS